MVGSVEVRCLGGGKEINPLPYMYIAIPVIHRYRKGMYGEGG
jgi:hypothetical protein